MLWKITGDKLELLSSIAKRAKFLLQATQGASFSSKGDRLVTIMSSRIETYPGVSNPKVLEKPTESLKVDVKEIVWPKPPPPLRDLARSAKSDTVAIACSDYHVRAFSWSTQNKLRHVRTLKGHQQAVTAVAFSSWKNHALVSADEAGKVILWDVKTGKALRQWQLPGVIHDLAFSRDGKHFATANGNGTCYLFRVTEWLTKVSN